MESFARMDENLPIITGFGDSENSAAHSTIKVAVGVLQLCFHRTKNTRNCVSKMVTSCKFKEHTDYSNEYYYYILLRLKRRRYLYKIVYLHRVGLVRVARAFSFAAVV